MHSAPRAALARLSCQHAAQASQASVELERLRQERANDAQHAQQLLTEAKDDRDARLDRHLALPPTACNTPHNGVQHRDLI